MIESPQPSLGALRRGEFFNAVTHDPTSPSPNDAGPTVVVAFASRSGSRSDKIAAMSAAVGITPAASPAKINLASRGCRGKAIHSLTNTVSFRSRVIAPHSVSCNKAVCSASEVGGSYQGKCSRSVSPQFNSSSTALARINTLNLGRVSQRHEHAEHFRSRVAGKHPAVCDQHDRHAVWPKPEKSALTAND